MPWVREGKVDCGAEWRAGSGNPSHPSSGLCYAGILRPIFMAQEETIAEAHAGTIRGNVQLPRDYPLPAAGFALRAAGHDGATCVASWLSRPREFSAPTARIALRGGER